MRFTSLATTLTGASVLAALAFLTVGALGCGPSQDARTGSRTPLADKWLERAKLSYRAGDFEDAKDAAQSALQAAPSDPDVRLLSARIALARLDYPQTLKLTEGQTSTDAHGLRGRAYWYSGDIEQAADELESMLQDPNVKDPWAREVAKLARRGAGRHPFAMEGGLVAAVEMPRAGPMLIVPCELEGEQILALVATATGELVVDSNSRKEAAWVNLRFGSLEVKDVPALTQDLGAISRQLGAPIKALLGVNLLRHMHATFDRRGDQFVARREEPSAPPDSTRVPLWYVRGGGMLLRAAVTSKKDDLSLLLVDTSQTFPLALEDSAWKKAGVDVSKLQPEPSMPSVKSGSVPAFALSGFDLPQMPAVAGLPIDELKSALDVDIAGIAGSGLMSLFRVTFGDEGRFVWFEPDPAMTQGMNAARSGAPPPPPPQASPPGAAPQLRAPMQPDARPGSGRSPGASPKPGGAAPASSSSAPSSPSPAGKPAPAAGDEKKK